ncbi:hypothetical protein GCM10010174_02250 [Kutzneria viridogrisea]|uniref:L,D-TPase catalytic domain-containing protein n=2 Tax=Kutzneria TaxID=43356 RepID=W5WHP3_9PSEU|nr:L,D-transpeptidase family protein [Kutzneria albida]AHH97669.1 hypothetical protein KALB_4307 [Kutzneria albida DSM 43870]MBA8924743.1 L,D-peptidoglycan transpeptidase YkuD (ErfK/YbiS/YcfS/YnhG family) [Kutzneria viridogrisea]
MGRAGQVITVRAEHERATTAVLTAWQRGAGCWRRVLDPVRAFVGSQGIGRASESSARTPAGVWPLTEGFGHLPVRTRLPYREIDAADWWVSDPASPLYNTYQRCQAGGCPFDESAGEALGRSGAVYDHAVVIDYNRSPVVPGAGSAFFLHVTGGGPTAGCVAIPVAELRTLLDWLDPSEHPVIDIAVR